MSIAAPCAAAACCPSHHPVPLQRPALPVRFDGLREVRAHQFCAVFQPVGVLAPHHDAFEVALAELAVVGVHPVAQLVQCDFACVQARHGLEAHLCGPGVAARGAPEALLLAVVHVKQHPPVGQGGVVKRVACGAPCAEWHSFNASPAICAAREICRH